MKKFIILILSAMFIACVVPASKPEPRVTPITNRCCDMNYNVRCIISPPTTVGSACYCYGQGVGSAC